MKNRLLIHQGKLLSKAIQLANLGNGSTWPGHIALKINPKFIKETLKNSPTKVIFIVGTNGKTTTTSLLSHLLKSDNKKVILNTSGANLINGIASTLILNSENNGKVKADFALFEIDENAFPLACKEVTPDAIVILNLFRDQLDRYGEINTIAGKWSKAITELPSSTKLFLNADDPQIAFLGRHANQKVYYFGVDNKGSTKVEHASDSTYCPACGNKLEYKKSYYSHLGDWSCPTGDFNHPQNVFTKSPVYPLTGLYNQYNINASVLCAQSLGVLSTKLEENLKAFKPVFGRQEQLSIEGKKIEVILAKNPAGFNQTLQTVLLRDAANILIVLNDRIADGTDVSWIWDVDFEVLKKSNAVLTLSGERVFDLALRFKYAELPATHKSNVAQAIKEALTKTGKDETLFILPTYTAMLEVRKIITGKKIL